MRLYGRFACNIFRAIPHMDTIVKLLSDNDIMPVFTHGEELSNTVDEEGIRKITYAATDEYMKAYHHFMRKNSFGAIYEPRDNQWYFDREYLLTRFESNYIKLYFILIKITYLLDMFITLDYLLQMDSSDPSSCNLFITEVSEMLNCNSYQSIEEIQEMYLICMHCYARYKYPLWDELLDETANPDGFNFSTGCLGVCFTKEAKFSPEYCLVHGLDIDGKLDNNLANNPVFKKASKPVLDYFRKCYKKVCQQEGYSEESFLHKMGYNVNESTIDRHNILSKALELYGSGYVIKFLNSLINSRKAQKGGEDKFMRAIFIWESDIKWIKRQKSNGDE